MELVERYRDLEVCRTSAGHLVVIDPLGSPADRLELLVMVAAAGAPDAIFFPTLEDAIEAIDAFVTDGLLNAP